MTKIPWVKWRKFERLKTSIGRVVVVDEEEVRSVGDQL